MSQRRHRSVRVIPPRKRGPRPATETPAQWRDRRWRETLHASMERAGTDTRWYLFAVIDSAKTLYWADQMARTGVSISVPERPSWRGVNGTVKGKREYLVQPFRPYIFVGVRTQAELGELVRRFHRVVRLQVDARHRPLKPQEIRDVHHRLGCQAFEPGGLVDMPSKYWDEIEQHPDVEITAGWLADVRGRVDRIDGDIARVVLDEAVMGMTDKVRVPLSDLRRVG